MSACDSLGLNEMALFDPMEWLSLGESLASGTSEAELRTAINRVYYACHLLARDRLFGDDKVGLKRRDTEHLTGDKRNTEHAAVSSAIARNTGVRKGPAKRLADQLTELRSMREQADYFRDSKRDEIQELFKRYNVTGWPGLARTATTRAKSLVPEIGALERYKRT